MQTQTAGFERLLLMSAAFVVVVAGMKAAVALLAPMMLAIFLVIISLPSLYFLHAKGLPYGLCVLLVLLTIAGMGLLGGLLVGNSLDSFLSQLPSYRARLHLLADGFLIPLRKAIALPALRDLLDPSLILQFFGQFLSGFSNLLSHAFVILLTVLFMLFEAAALPAKWRAAFGNEGRRVELLRMVAGIRHYLAIKTSTSLLTGIALGLWLWALQVDYPLLWGSLAFLLNFVPNIGSLLAALPALLLALVQGGSSLCLLTAAGYIVVNVLVGQWLEPKMMGRRLGLSTLVVFLSLVFWGWVLGAVGALLSVPLTMIVRIALESRPHTRWLAILLGPDKEQ